MSRPPVRERIVDGICRRSFSSPEAFAYETWIAPALATIVEPVIRRALVGTNVLDVGCGGGLVAAALTRQGPHRVVGVDPSISQVRRFARRRAGAQVWAVRGAAERLPFSDRSFDSLYSSCAWKHWPLPAEGVAECTRVTRPGGSVVIVEIDGASSADDFFRFAQRTGVPGALRSAYVRFALRTVVSVAPTQTELASSFDGLDLGPLSIARLGELPFLVASAQVGNGQ